VLVPVAVVGRVPVLAMDEIGVVVVGDGGVATALTVGMVVTVVGHVDGGDALVPVPAVVPVDVAVVEVIGVVVMKDCDVPAAHAVGVLVTAVGLVVVSGHG
jgi:hypothetical protein